MSDTHTKLVVEFLHDNGFPVQFAERDGVIEASTPIPNAEDQKAVAYGPDRYTAACRLVQACGYDLQ